MNAKNKIKLLDESVYNKIAAGEVVGRPASVVKELIENAIDAGAQNVTVIVKDAGKRLIQVSDDGTGMSEFDAALSVKRHATSKIETADDLESIGTFGFRGEALSSIAAVSNLTIMTKTSEEDLGTVVTVEENGDTKIGKEALPQGTSVIVKNLFYNVPARRNFLKSNQTELKRIFDTFNHIALAFPEISFEFFVDDKLKTKYESGGLRERLAAIFGEQILDLTLELEETSEFISAFGFVAKPTYLTDSKNNQHLYVNGRYVKNKTVANAVFAAYEGLLAKGEYPFYALFLVIDTKMIDVNVHPAKEEIKFYNDAEIFSFIKAVVKKALGSYDFIPNVKIEEKKTANKLRAVVTNASEKKDVLKENSLYGGTGFDDELDLFFGGADSSAGRQIDLPFGEKQNASSKKVSPQKKEKPLIFYAHKKYIVSQIKSGLMIIDANRAQRRIFFEKAQRALAEGIPFSQQLLFSQTFQLKKEDYELLQNYDEKLTRLGFEIKYYGKNTISISGVPAEVKLGTEAKTLLGILNELKKYGEGDVDKIIAETYAKEASVKEGEELTEGELRLIIDQLFSTKVPEKTPEGKRIFIKITNDEILNRLDKG